MAEWDYLTLDDLLVIAQRLLGDVGIRELGLLESAVARPQTTIMGEPAYPTLGMQAAALMHSIVRFHPLVDGNKRLGWAAARAFVLLNGQDFTYSVDEAEEFVLAAARGELDVPDIAVWFVNHGLRNGPWPHARSART